MKKGKVKRKEACSRSNVDRSEKFMVIEILKKTKEVRKNGKEEYQHVS